MSDYVQHDDDWELFTFMCWEVTVQHLSPAHSCTALASESVGIV